MRYLQESTASFALAAAVLFLGCACPAQGQGPTLRVSENQRFLTYEGGDPFFYLGDTAWELFHRLNREETDRYLCDRSSKGFTVIQAVVVAELDGLKTPNAYGEVPFIDMDPTRPNEAYFAHVDWVVDKAQSYGLFVGMLPTWGSWFGGFDGIKRNSTFFNKNNAREYGRFLGERYGDKQVIWILGGDRVADQTRGTWEQLALGIRDTVGERQLIAYHPRGGHSSSEWFTDAAWLDFHMAQSGHSPSSTNYTYIEKDYALGKTKPCMDAEPAYEYPPDAMPKRRPVGALQVRRNAYWAVFAGAHGHTYGTHPIWQMYDKERTPLWDVVTPWHEALDLPGAVQLRYLKELMLSRPYLTRIPDQSLLANGSPEGIKRIQVTRNGTHGSKDASYIFVYFPSQYRLELKTTCITGNTLRTWWMNPRTGECSSPSECTNVSPMTFDPPSQRTDEDWVLVIDDASKGYPPPRHIFDINAQPAVCQTRDTPVVRWTANRDEMNFRYDFLRNIETTTLHRGTPEMGAFNHHAHIIYFDGVFYVAWDTQLRDEHGPGQHGLLRRSRDQGKTWTPVEELFPPMDRYIPSSEAIVEGRYRGRIQTCNGFAVVDDVLYVVTEVDDHRGTSIRNRRRYHAGRLCRSINPDGGLGELFWLAYVAPETVKGFSSYPAGDPKLVKKINQYFQQPGNEIQLDFSSPVPKSAPGDVWTPFPISDDNHRLIEQVPSYRAADGTWVRLYRDAGLIGVKIPDNGSKRALEESKSRRNYASYSRDNGKTWTVPTRTSFPDACAKSNAGKLPDGQVYVINNVLPLSTKHGGRQLLGISLSRDGLNFDRVAVIRFVPPPQRYEGRAKSGGFAYPHSVVVGDNLWVVYSVNKEDIELARIPLDELYKIEGI